MSFASSKGSQSFSAWFETQQQQQQAALAAASGKGQVGGDGSGSEYFKRLSGSKVWSATSSLGAAVQERLGIGGAASSDAGAAGDLESGAAGSSAGGLFGEQATWSSLSRSERFKGFVGLLLVSCFFFVMSFFFLSVVLLFPAKFAFSFTMGSMSFMAAFAVVQGPWNWAKAVCSSERIGFTLCYIGSMLGTLYACLGWQSYILVILFSVVQLCSLLYYGASYVPGGKAGLAIVASAMKGMLRRICLPCARAACRGVAGS